MKSNLQVLLYLDYDAQSGFGHISRSRTIIETLSNCGAKIFLTSKLNPLEIELQMDFFDQIKWISHQEAQDLYFNLVYVDTYSHEILNRVESLTIEHKLLLIDSNYSESFPTWPDMIIDLERSTPRNECFKGLYLFGDILSNVKLELSKQDRKKCRDRESGHSNLKALVNFGGSRKVESFLKILKSTFSNHNNIQYYVYCPSTLVENLKAYFRNDKNVVITSFNNDYLKNLATCDFLITNSGTSFIEGLFVDVPMVIFNLFHSAQANFERLRDSHQVLYSGSIAELESNWQSDVLYSLQLKRNLSSFITDNISKLKVLDQDTLKVALIALNL